MKIETKLYYALEKLTLWAELIEQQRCAEFRASCKARREERDRSWQPGVRGDLQKYAYLEDNIVREEESMKEWAKPIREANAALDEAIPSPSASPVAAE